MQSLTPSIAISEYSQSTRLYFKSRKSMLKVTEEINARAHELYCVCVCLQQIKTKTSLKERPCMSEGEKRGMRINDTTMKMRLRWRALLYKWTLVAQHWFASLMSNWNGNERERFRGAPQWEEFRGRNGTCESFRMHKN